MAMTMKRRPGVKDGNTRGTDEVEEEERILIDFSLDVVCCECSCDTLPTLAELVGECMNLDDGVM